MPKPISMVITHDKSCSMVIMYGHDNDCEVREVKTLFRRLHGQVLRRDDEDVMSWWASKKGLFIVKSFYSSLSLCNARMFHSGIVWNPWAPNKVSFFAWEDIWGRILTLGQLKRSYFLPNRCYLCKVEEKSANHLHFHCPKAAMIWQLIFALFGVQWVMPSSIKETILSWHDSFVGKKAWNAAPLCLFWILWKEWNRRALKTPNWRIKLFYDPFVPFFGMGQGACRFFIWFHWLVGM